MRSFTLRYNLSQINVVMRIIYVVFLIICGLSSHLIGQKSILPTVKKGHVGLINSARYSPNGAFILTSSSDRTIKLWDSFSGKELYTFVGHNSWVESADFNKDGNQIFSRAKDRTVKCWNLETGIVNATFREKGFTLGDPGYNSLKNLVFTFNDKNVLTIFNANDKKAIRVIKRKSGYFKSASFSPDAQFISTLSNAMDMSFWNLKTGNLTFKFKIKGEGANSFCFHPENSKVIIIDSTNSLLTIDLLSGKKNIRFQKFEDSITYLSYSPQGEQVITAHEGGVVKLWNPESGQLLHRLDSHTDFISLVKINREHTLALLNTSDETVQLWDLKSKTMIFQIKSKSKNGFTDFSFSPDGKTALLVDPMNAGILDLNTFNVFNFTETDFQIPNSARFSPTGKTVASASKNGIHLWDIFTGQDVREIKFPGISVWDAKFSPDGELMAINGSDSTIRLINLMTGEETHKFSNGCSYFIEMDFSSDGKYLLAAEPYWISGKTKVWDISTGKPVENEVITPVHGKIYAFSLLSSVFGMNNNGDLVLLEMYRNKRFTNLKSYTKDLCYRSDYRQLDAVLADWTISCYRIPNLTIFKNFIGHTDQVTAVHASADGKYLVSASLDSTVRKWDLSSGKLIHTFRGHGSPVNRAEFSPDGRFILSHEMGFKTILWDAETGDILYTRYLLPDNEWLCMDKNFYYDGSSKGLSQPYLLKGKEIVLDSSLIRSFHIPGMVEQIMKAKK